MLNSLFAQEQTQQDIEQWLPLTQPDATVVASLGVVLAASLAFIATWLGRRQTEKHFRLSNHRDRFTTVAGQLADPSAAVRIAGVYAMEALADDWLQYRWYTLPKKRKTVRHEAQTCINVLCSYLCLPYEPSGREHAHTKTVIRYAPSDRVVEEHHEHRTEDSQVRQAILRIIAAHLRPDARTSWSGFDFDFTGAYLENTDFADCVFRGNVAFTRSRFHGDTTSFVSARFHGKSTSFADAQFYGDIAVFELAQFHGELTSFAEAQFHSRWIVFEETQFHSELNSFKKARFDSAQTWFRKAQFHGSAMFEEASFRGRETLFDQAEFHGESTWFVDAQFHNERTSFARAKFQSKLLTWFVDAQFHSERTSFAGATFQNPQTLFNGALFRGQRSLFVEVQFDSASTSFFGAKFESGETSFANAHFHGTVDFSDPQVWRNVVVDWQWPLAHELEGPATAQPASVLPVDWPPVVS